MQSYHIHSSNEHTFRKHRKVNSSEIPLEGWDMDTGAQKQHMLPAIPGKWSVDFSPSTAQPASKVGERLSILRYQRSAKTSSQFSSGRERSNFIVEPFPVWRLALAGHSMRSRPVLRSCAGPILRSLCCRSPPVFEWRRIRRWTSRGSLLLAALRTDDVDQVRAELLSFCSCSWESLEQ